MSRRRMSTRERDLMNRAIGHDQARDVLVDEWKRQGCPAPTSAIWKLIEALDADHLDERREWRKLQAQRIEADRRPARRPRRKGTK